MKILLTGSTGMVGRNLLEHPRLNNYFLSIPTRQQLDLRDYSQVEQYLQQQLPDMVIHAAGKVGGIIANINDPINFLVENFDIGRNIVCAAHRLGIKKLLNLGSSCIYPKNYDTPIGEDCLLAGKLEPTNEGYALAKIAVAKLCEYISRENQEYQYKTIIPCNLYGRWDHFDPEFSHMLPSVIAKIQRAKVQKQPEVSIWGDGSARREFMYAGDFADFVASAISQFERLPLLMNVGLGYDHSIDEYYQVIAQVVGYLGKFTHDLTRPMGMQRKLLDISKQRQFGWQATTNLIDGIEHTYRYYLQHYYPKQEATN